MKQNIKILVLLILWCVSVYYWIWETDESFRYILIFPISLIAYLAGRVVGRIKSKQETPKTAGGETGVKTSYPPLNEFPHFNPNAQM